jgi:DUF4097 and DUF4098 domain-containing protein YvlB
MRKRPSFFLAAVLLAFAGAASAERPTSIDKVNGSIRTEEGAQYRSLETVNGSIVLATRASAENIETVNGSITLRENSRGGEVETVNGAITIGEAAQVDSAETVNGAIRLDRGALSKGNIETVNGTLQLEGAEVGGNLNTVNGDINVLDGSRVAGGIKIEKPGGSWFNWGGKQRTPTVVIGANSEVAGPMVFEREVELFVHESARIGSVSGAEVKRFTGARP